MPKPFVTIELDKPRRLRYGINALCMIEDLLGYPLTEMDPNKLGMKEVRNVLYAGLAWEDEELTPEKVGDLIDEYSSITEAIEKMNRALSDALGKNNSGPTGES